MTAPTARQPADDLSDPLVSVIIPARNCETDLREALSWLSHTHGVRYELIVVDDASTDGTARAAEEMGAEVVRLETNVGPAEARNAGAAVARGEYLVFIDADVGVKPDTLGRILQTFWDAPWAAAVFGSYDLSPAAGNVLSQYRNLLHHFVHQTSREEAATFWAGCGAVRADVFRQVGGFDASFDRPSIEDIAFGVRLRQAGYRIRLNKAIQVTHFKRWTLRNILKTDIWYRGVPWTRLILAQSHMPNDLNLKWTQRLSVVLTYALLATALVGAWLVPGLLLLPIALVAGVIAIDYWSNRQRIPTVVRVFGVIAAGGSVGLLTALFHVWALVPLTILAAIVVLNHWLYRFFAHERYFLFAVFVIPMHVLYFAYCGFAFALGVAFHFRDGLQAADASAPPVKRMSRTTATR
ncbi:MAG: glycosyltransferase [Gemmataceae bacterium]